MRRRSDVDRLREALGSASRIAIVGGGYIGLETAAVLRTLGKEVVLVEALPRLLARVAGEDISHFFEQEHRTQGVGLRLAAAVEGIETAAGRAAGLRLQDRETVPADLVIVGIGIDAAVAPLAAAGAEGANGVDVDAFCRTTIPGVYAVGDCAAHENRFAGGLRIRLESVQNAHDMAAMAARAIAGAPEAYAALPWFWSNQYDLRLQSAGLAVGHDQAVVRGEPGARSFSVVYLLDGRVIAIDCVNATRDYVQGRQLIEKGVRVAADAVADASTPLKSLAG